MSKSTVTREEVVEKKETITTCDYCQLMTDRDIEDDEEFGKILLVPSFILNDQISNQHHLVQQLIKAENQGQVMRVLREIERSLLYAERDAADICPGCANSLFGDGPATGIRQGTGYIQL